MSEESPKKIKLPPLRKKGRNLADLPPGSLTAALFHRERLALEQPQVEQPQVEQKESDHAED